MWIPLLSLSRSLPLTSLLPTYCSSRSMKFDGVMPLVVAASASSASCLVYEYEVDFYRAFMTFHHQTVFDPVARCMKPLQPFEQPAHDAMYPAYMHITPGQATSELFPFLGCIMQDSSVAAGIADGLVDPNTLEAFNLPELLENVSHLHRRHSDSSRGASSRASEAGGRVCAYKREAPVSSKQSGEVLIRQRQAGSQSCPCPF
jgi:hypothetical protein